MATVIVTGAAGFIGKAVVAHLRRTGHDVVPVGRERGDVATSEFWDALPRADHLIHLAGRSYVPDSWKAPADFYAANVVGTARAADYCRRTQAHLVFVSSYVYGAPKHLPIGEEHPLAPGSPYALSKVLAEQVCAFHAESERLPVTVVRPFNVFGPGQRSDFLIAAVVDQIRQGDTIRVKDLAPRRDYLFIDDLVSGLERAMHTPVGLRIFNMGSGSSHSVQDVIDLAQDVAGTRLGVDCEDVTRQNEIPEVRADTTLARTQLDWIPRVSLREGLASMLADRVAPPGAFGTPGMTP
jgi:GDP-4-dehydro-6-deoxy-D-mannose reductase